MRWGRGEGAAEAGGEGQSWTRFNPTGIGHGWFLPTARFARYTPLQTHVSPIPQHVQPPSDASTSLLCVRISNIHTTLVGVGVVEGFSRHGLRRRNSGVLLVPL